MREASVRSGSVAGGNVSFFGTGVGAAWDYNQTGFPEVRAATTCVLYMTNSSRFAELGRLKLPDRDLLRSVLKLPNTGGSVRWQGQPLKDRDKSGSRRLRFSPFGCRRSPSRAEVVREEEPRSTSGLRRKESNVECGSFSRRHLDEEQLSLT